MRFDHHKLRILAAPKGRGAGEQWVREQYAVELRAHRRRAPNQNVGLLILIDADRFTVKNRHDQLGRELANSNQEDRRPNERIAIWIPRRRIETWVAWLLGEEVTEQTERRWQNTNRDYKRAAARFVELYDQPSDRPSDILPSITTALEETGRIDKKERSRPAKK